MSQTFHDLVDHVAAFLLCQDLLDIRCSTAKRTASSVDTIWTNDPLKTGAAQPVRETSATRFAVSPRRPSRARRPWSGRRGHDGLLGEPVRRDAPAASTTTWSCSVPSRNGKRRRARPWRIAARRAALDTAASVVAAGRRSLSSPRVFNAYLPVLISGRRLVPAARSDRSAPRAGGPARASFASRSASVSPSGGGSSRSIVLSSPSSAPVSCVKAVCRRACASALRASAPCASCSNGPTAFARSSGPGRGMPRHLPAAPQPGFVGSRQRLSASQPDVVESLLVGRQGSSSSPVRRSQ